MVSKRDMPAVVRFFLAVGGTFGLLCAIPQGGAGQDVSYLARENSLSSSFHIEGRPVNGMFLGRRKRLAVSLVNPYPFPIAVVEVHGTVVRTSHQGCRPGSINLQVGAYSEPLPLRVNARSSSDDGSLSVYMPLAAAAACADTTFTIRLDGVATRTRRR